MSIVGAFMVPHPPMIVPDVGRGSEEQIVSTTQAYNQVADEIAALKPETIIISSPHSVMYADYFHISPGRAALGSFKQFGAGNVKFNIDYDEQLTKHLSKLADEQQFPAGTMGERDRELDHGTMVPLYFITKKYTDFKLVRTGLSGLDLLTHYQYGMMIKKAIEDLDRRVVYVASGDLSHKLQDYGPYGFAPEGPKYDDRIMDVCSHARFNELLDFDEQFLDKAAECGHRSFVIMAGSLDGVNVDAKQLVHEDITGVGYGICTFTPTGPDEDRHFLDKILRDKENAMMVRRDNEDEYVKLARASLEYYVKNHSRMATPKQLSEGLVNRRAGAFVSVHKNGQLRGCIGTILPTQDSLAEEIINNAISACSKDPRFNPIEEDELKWLEISVDVLGDPEPIDSPDKLDVKRYGVIVESGYKRGLLLPDLDGVDTVEEQIDIARQKAGIPAGTKLQLSRFEVVRHH